uniref:Hydrogenase/urease accessory protein HupE/UreJ n=1 Tax=Candidatus Nitrotoga fabula TaxID=2182327 RepID=A0A2X0QSA5_9PROT|nr:Hydrogenase/urease accessory protein HupE/UreJ [Candidatus Nitrotoga fabula]
MEPSEKFLIFLILLGVSDTASAHPGHEVSGLMAGLMHPFSGMDHLLAMMAVGLWAVQNGNRQLWLLPGTFMVVMALGAMVAMAYPLLPLMESGIAASVLLLGMFTMLSLQVAARFSVAVTGLFGFFHGYAHGLEILGDIDTGTYALGFLAATAALHFSGILIGIAARPRFLLLTRMLGAVITASGIWMLSSA